MSFCWHRQVESTQEFLENNHFQFNSESALRLFKNVIRIFMPVLKCVVAFACAISQARVACGKDRHKCTHTNTNTPQQILNMDIEQAVRKGTNLIHLNEHVTAADEPDKTHRLTFREMDMKSA
ncbi:hypothetical protein HELRODRAFT_159062 [Helobdella robusta]|uniref:Uncharacterized protein n=1 Tax=Helobdella robusta TaxID=6412 RepID=T1ENJ5_HELRO|nr:hypothetical protein HELRODRAFT_159062 [Helobdella robusta]ESO12510.1 hypothetical protein HELRODRAFT_159062 [Helobdella robusta]